MSGAPAPVGYQLDLFVSAERGSGARTYLASLILDSGAHCAQCRCREIYTRRVGAHTGAYCAGAGCGRWVKWLNPQEKARLAAQGGAV